MAFTIPVYAAILTSRKAPDVIHVYEHEADALACCQYWLARCHGYIGQDVPGLRLFVQYGTDKETIRIEQLHLRLDEPSDDDLDTLDPDPVSLTAADRRFLRVVETLSAEERGAVRGRGLDGEDA